MDVCSLQCTVGEQLEGQLDEEDVVFLAELVAIHINVAAEERTTQA